MEHRFFRHGEDLHQTYTVRKEGRQFSVRVAGGIGGSAGTGRTDFPTAGDDKEVEASTVALGEHRFLLRFGGRQLVVDWARRGREVFLQVDGRGCRLKEEDAAHVAGDEHGDASSPNLESPLPGRVVKVLVGPGGQVKKGQPIVIIDSMKIEFEFKAPRAGVVDQVLAVEGRQIDVGQTLVVLKA